MGAPTDLHNWLTDQELLRMTGTLPAARIEALFDEIEALRAKEKLFDAVEDLLNEMHSYVEDANQGVKHARDQIEDDLDNHVGSIEDDKRLTPADLDIAQSMRGDIMGTLSKLEKDTDEYLDRATGALLEFRELGI